MSGQANLKLPSGGSITIAGQDSASNFVATLPANNGTVITTESTFGGTGPAFSAYQSSAQTVTSGVEMKIQFQTEEFDTANCFDNTTNYRFTPNVAGYYQINSAATAGSTASSAVVFVYKNGVRYKAGNYTSGAYSYTGSVSALVYCNGTTDYIEIYGYFSVGQILNANIAFTYFQAFLARSA